jgi:CheY-like chemotaxis protein
VFTSLLSQDPFHDYHIRIEVEDQGIGISADEMKDLFAPFRQAQRLTGGTGLGLFSLAKRSESLLGHYGVEPRSDGSQGIKFWFSFPYQPDKAMAKVLELGKDGASSLTVTPSPSGKRTPLGGYGSPKEPRKLLNPINTELPTEKEILQDSPRDRSNVPFRSPSPPKRFEFSEEGTEEQIQHKIMNILIVDDSMLIIRVVTNLLIGEGHTVVAATNGVEAIDRLNEQLDKSDGQPFDVILMDMQMAVMDGIEATRRIRSFEAERMKSIFSSAKDDKELDILKKLDCYQCIIALSANLDNRTIERAYGAGVDDYVLKRKYPRSIYLCICLVLFI